MNKASGRRADPGGGRRRTAACRSGAARARKARAARDASDLRASWTVRPRGACGPSRDGGSAPVGRPWWPCAHGNRGRALAVQVARVESALHVRLRCARKTNDQKQRHGLAVKGRGKDTQQPLSVNRGASNRNRTRYPQAREAVYTRPPFRASDACHTLPVRRSRRLWRFRSGISVFVVWKRSSRTVVQYLDPAAAGDRGRWRLRLLAPNRYVVDWVNQNCAGRIGELIEELVPAPVPRVSVEIGRVESPRRPCPLRTASTCPCSRVARQVRAAGLRRARSHARAAPNRCRSLAAASTRTSPSATSSRARATSSRAPRRCRSPRTRVEPTTRCSSTAASVSARRT